MAGHLTRAARAQGHPAEDFLFSYYSLRPGQLRRWHPGAGHVLLGPPRPAQAGWRWYQQVPGPDGRTGWGLDLDAFLAGRGHTVRFVRDLLAATAARPAQLGCFALHEWAMVYRLPGEQVRHATWPLRLGSTGSDAVVEAHRLRCTHHDAFRFFTPQAAPRNEAQPRRTDQLALEQPGCLHATMDLYKWSYKLAPAVPSDLVVDCFELAAAARTLDVRASPYDLRALGYRPIPIETAEGRAEFVEVQRELIRRAAPLRDRLLQACQALLDAIPSERPAGAQDPAATARTATSATATTPATPAATASLPTG